MKTRALFAIAIALASTACTRNQQQPDASPAPAVTSANPAITASAPATITAVSQTAAPAATPIATVNPLASVTFSDIAGIFAETAIKQEAAAGLFGMKTGKFEPYGSIARGQFVQWLATINNMYFAKDPGTQIRYAEADSDQTFVDVPKGSRYFKYVQGMVNSGFVVGIDKTHFAPDRSLTREEMIAIMTSREQGANPLPKAGPPATWSSTECAGSLGVPLSDRDKISKPYWGAFQANNGWGCSRAYDLVKRVYGNTKLFSPQKLATRADVAVLLQHVGGADAANLVPH
jgi:hypothetical protein